MRRGNIKAMKNSLRGGFTLVELLTVMAIILVLTSLLMVAVAKMKGGASVATAQQTISQLYSAVELFELETGSLPKEESGNKNRISMDTTADAASPYLPQGVLMQLDTNLLPKTHAYIAGGGAASGRFELNQGYLNQSYREGKGAAYEKKCFLVNPWGFPYYYDEGTDNDSSSIKSDINTIKSGTLTNLDYTKLPDGRSNRYRLPGPWSGNSMDASEDDDLGSYKRYTIITVNPTVMDGSTSSTKDGVPVFARKYARKIP